MAAWLTWYHHYMIEEKPNINYNKVGWAFRLLFAVNFTYMGMVRYIGIPLPISVVIEFFYLVTLVYVVSSAQRLGGTLSNAFGTLFGIYSIWFLYSLAEIANTSAEIPYNTILTRWFAEVRTMTFQVVYGFVIFSAIFNTKDKIRVFHRFWGFFVLLAIGKCLIQQYIGFDSAEQEFLVSAARTHYVSGIIRYFSFFSDAANFGSNMAATTVIFAALALTAQKKRDKTFFAIVSTAALYGMMASGTRSAIIALAAGLATYALISKNVRAIVATAALGAVTVGILMFTNIGQGNSMIRRMRSAFRKDDASLAVRELNKAAMKKYLREVPMGLGVGIAGTDVPPNNKNHYLATIPPDSTWVYIDIHYGIIGKYAFLFSFFGIIVFGATKVLTRIKDKEVTGQMAATVSGCMAMFIAGYSNQIMMQYPNCLLFFGSMGMLAVAEIVDKKALADREKETLRLLGSDDETLLLSEAEADEKAKVGEDVRLDA